MPDVQKPKSSAFDFEGHMRAYAAVVSAEMMPEQTSPWMTHLVSRVVDEAVRTVQFNPIQYDPPADPYECLRGIAMNIAETDAEEVLRRAKAENGTKDEDLLSLGSPQMGYLMSTPYQEYTAADFEGFKALRAELIELKYVRVVNELFGGRL